MSIVRIRVLGKDYLGRREPLQNIMVHLISSSRRYSDDTDANGWAEFHNIPDDKYIIKIRASGYRPYTEKQYISRNSIIEIVLNKAIV